MSFVMTDEFSGTFTKVIKDQCLMNSYLSDFGLVLTH